MTSPSQARKRQESEQRRQRDSMESEDSETRVGGRRVERSWADERLSVSQSPKAIRTQRGEYGQKRRSSISVQFNSLKQAGGVNSLENFAKSWQRATGFWDIQPILPSHRYSGVDNDSAEYNREDVEATPESRRSLLRIALDDERRPGSESAIEEEQDETADAIDDAVKQRLSERRTSVPEEDIFQIQPQLASPSLGATVPGTYGSLATGVNESSKRDAGRLFLEQQAGSTGPDKERVPLLVKQVEEEDGRIVNVYGKSTLPQTVFNSVNTLVGIGLLSLPLGLKYSGWLIGMTFFLFVAVSTSYTARLLAKCLNVNDALLTFSDLAWASYGNRARTATSILFTFELTAVCVALVVLFADSMDVLIPGWGTTEWKIVCGIILIPLGFLPLSVLSFSSFVGIVCCFGIVFAILVDGLAKPHSPGSLREPAPTSLFPMHWGTVPLGFGLLLSPWGGHGVFPNIYRDMRHPRKYPKAVNVTYIFTYVLDTAMAIIGFLMFGEGVRDEITANILLTSGYPKATSIVIVICIAIIPLTKVPLSAKPIVSTIELACGLDSRTMAASPGLAGMSGLSRGILRLAIRILTIVVFVVLATLVPSFDRIMSLLGSVACFLVALILPLLFHLKMFGKRIPWKERALNWFLIIICSVMAVVSTVFAFLPKRLIMSL